MTNTISGVNGSGCNRSVCEREILLKQLVRDLDLEKSDIAKQLECLKSRGKSASQKLMYG
jgi:hypothetical protein